MVYLILELDGPPATAIWSVIHVDVPSRVGFVYYQAIGCNLESTACILLVSFRLLQSFDRMSYKRCGELRGVIGIWNQARN